MAERTRRRETEPPDTPGQPTLRRTADPRRCPYCPPQSAACLHYLGRRYDLAQAKEALGTQTGTLLAATVSGARSFTYDAWYIYAAHPPTGPAG